MGNNSFSFDTLQEACCIDNIVTDFQIVWSGGDDDGPSETLQFVVQAIPGDPALPAVTIGDINIYPYWTHGELNTNSYACKGMPSNGTWKINFIKPNQDLEQQWSLNGPTGIQIQVGFAPC